MEVLMDFIISKSFHLHSSQYCAAMAFALLFASKFLARTFSNNTNSTCSACLKAATISCGSDSWEAERPCKIIFGRETFVYQQDSAQRYVNIRLCLCQQHWSHQYCCLEYGMAAPSPPLLSCLLPTFKLISDQSIATDYPWMISNIKLN